MSSPAAAADGNVQLSMFPEQPEYNPDTEYLSAAQLAPELPGAPHPSTLSRWALRGVLAGDGVRVRMKAVKVGARLLFTRAWAADFQRELTGRNLRHVEPTARERRKSTFDAAAAYLKRAGA
ncbi:MAG: hypothetical protein HRF50_04355 [Phycisphaerae bacterium]|jgi:hypothetical protein